MKKSVILTSVHMLLSGAVTGIGASKDFPFGIVAGLTVVFIIIAVLAAASGTILGLQNFRRAWLAMILSAILAVPALIFYSSLLSRGGLTFGQIVLAGFLYFYIFFVIFFVLTFFEKSLPPISTVS